MQRRHGVDQRGPQPAESISAPHDAELPGARDGMQLVQTPSVCLVAHPRVPHHISYEGRPLVVPAPAACVLIQQSVGLGCIPTVELVENGEDADHREEHNHVERPAGRRGSSPQTYERLL